MPTSRFGTKGLLGPELGHYRSVEGIIKITLNNVYTEATFLFSLYNTARLGLYFLVAMPFRNKESVLAVIGYMGVKAYVSGKIICIVPNNIIDTRIDLSPLTSNNGISKIETISNSDFDNIKSELVEINPQNLL